VVQDAFVSVLSEDMNQLLYSTYIGGHANDSGNAITVNDDGDVFFTGYSADHATNDFNTTSGVFQPDNHGGQDVIVCKLRVHVNGLTIKDSSGNMAAVFDDRGNLYLKGALDENSVQSPSGGADEFIVKDVNDNVVAFINTANGNMYIDGTKHVNQGTLSPAGNDFVVRDKDNNVVAYISEAGELYLKGEIRVIN
jgi:hypothetical protein